MTGGKSARRRWLPRGLFLRRCQLAMGIRKWEGMFPLAAITGTAILVPYLEVKSLQLTWRSGICRRNQRVPELHMVDFTAWQGTRIVAPAMAALTQQGLCNLLAVCVRSCVRIVGDIPMIFTGAKYSCEPLPGAWYVRHDAWSPLRNTLWSQADDARAAFVAVMILPRWPRGEVTYWAQNKSHHRLVLCRRSHFGNQQAYI